MTINDFGIEIDLASQIVRNNFFIYEFGVSYYFRTKAQGKKISWIDGIKSFYYLIKVRFYDNNISTNLSILYSSIYMAYVGSHFGMGLECEFIILDKKRCLIAPSFFNQIIFLTTRTHHIMLFAY